MNSPRHPLSNAFLKQCYRVDSAKIKRRLYRLNQRKNGDAASQRDERLMLEQLALKAAAKVELRQKNRPKISYPKELPISQKRIEIAEAITANQVVIITGETGSGKTTQLPKICLELGLGNRGFIGHTQPRRLAARTVATRIAQELNSPLGEAVGFKVRFVDAIKLHSYIKLMTDGLLLAELTSDKYLDQYDAIIIDEAHERSLNIDFILGYLKTILKKRPDLKIIITSATIDVQRFSQHFDGAPIIEVSGRTYPVETRYRPLLTEQGTIDLTEGIFRAVEELIDEGLGDILIFMNGEREIRDLAEQLGKKQYPDSEILPLYARLSYREQAKVFNNHVGRRIVLATNVAETSLTVPGIRYVIDPGTARISRYSYRTKVQRLPIEVVSQSSANQRQGRCGRVAPGICIRLYDEADFTNRPEFTDPEILRTNLAAVILQMLAIGLGRIDSFPFIQPPDERYVRDGLLLLDELQAVERHQGKLRLTPLGRKLAVIPLDPRLARMVVQANEYGCLNEMLIISAALSIQDPRERPFDKKQAADEAHGRFSDSHSEFAAWLNLWNYLKSEQQTLSANQFKKLCQRRFLAYMRVREWQDLYAQLRQVVADLKWELNSQPANGELLHKAILSGLLSQVGFKDKTNEYLGARNRSFFVFPASPLAKKGPKWIMAVELVETSRLFARYCAKIEPEWLEHLAAHLVKKSYVEPHFEAKQGSVIALENQQLYGLTIVNRRRIQYGSIDAVAAREIFIRSALAAGELQTKEAFFVNNRRLIEDIESLEHKSRRRDILVDEQALVDFYEARIPAGIYNTPKLLKWWQQHKQVDPHLLDFERAQLMQRSDDHVRVQDFPDHWQQGNFKLALSYHFEPTAEDDGVSVHVPLALLNQIDNDGFDWQIQGLREQRITALLKSLPKALRRNFVPAPDYARACLQAMAAVPTTTPLLTAMSKQLLRMTGVSVKADNFNVAQLPEHLNINFKVEDEQCKLVAQGRDITAIREKLQTRVTQALKVVVDPEIEQTEITQWNFGDLPKEYKQQKGGFEFRAFPALVDNKVDVAIKLFDDEHQAQRAHSAGLRRLLLLNSPSAVKHLQRNLENKAKLALYFNPFGQVQLLIDDILAASVQLILDKKSTEVRTMAQFEQAKTWLTQELNSNVTKVALQVEEVLIWHQKLSKRLKGKIDLAHAVAMSDIKTQLAKLVFKGFVQQSGAQRLPDLVRYMKAIDNRLDKLPVETNRDRLHQLSIGKVQSLLDAHLAKIARTALIPEVLLEIRWMIEEYRVSCFAQVLGTAYPISEKRIIKRIEQI